MRRIVVCLILLGFMALPAFAQDVNIDYAKDFDFGKVKTFQYVKSEAMKGHDDLMDARIKEGILSRMKARGLQEVTSNPDVYVTYNVSTEQNTTYHTSSMGYGGYGPGWYTWGTGYVDATTTAMTYTVGTLIVDAYEPKEKKLIWRATGTQTVKDSPEKRAKQIDKILTKMGQKWQKILANKGK